MSRRKHLPGTEPPDDSDELDWAQESWTQHVRRTEQDLIERVIQGNEAGHYFVVLGPKVGMTFPSVARPADACVVLSGFREDNYDA